MGNRLDLTGVRFGRLTAQEFAGSIKGVTYWYCSCDCGVETLTNTQHLRSGSTQSCGCHRAGVTAERNSSDEMRQSKTKHGGARRDIGMSTEYTTWRKMKQTSEYIEEWKEFKQFFRDIGWRPGDKYELSRHDVRQPHSKENTYWRNTNEERQQRQHLNIADEFCIDMSSINDTHSFTREADPARERQEARVY